VPLLTAELISLSDVGSQEVGARPKWANGKLWVMGCWWATRARCMAPSAGEAEDTVHCGREARPSTPGYWRSSRADETKRGRSSIMTISRNPLTQGPQLW